MILKILGANQKENSFIDTEIWSFSQKIPERKKFSSKKNYEKALLLHKNAHSFLEEQIQKESNPNDHSPIN
jgi:hypothetical protein